MKSGHTVPPIVAVIADRRGSAAAAITAIMTLGESGEKENCGARRAAQTRRKSMWKRPASARATHSSGKKLSDIADVVIDNCVRQEDALVAVDGWPHPVSAGSTVAVVAASMTVLGEVALRLANRGAKPPVFVSPNVNPDVRFNDTVFEAHRELLRKL